ncbi:hypothetical protein [Acrocarpospora catenulata]|uniref:hypothetical protein n=1 Tax=Acrocarpospora catenulata TaxID=2836182 RepID=UPI001BDA5C57|nr:hypothetical protein [Acrocarpospora catenulata]
MRRWGGSRRRDSSALVVIAGSAAKVTLPDLGAAVDALRPVTAEALLDAVGT